MSINALSSIDATPLISSNRLNKKSLISALENNQKNFNEEFFNKYLT